MDINKDKGENAKEKSGGNKGTWRSMWNASTIGMAFVTSIFIGAGMGYLLDRWLGTEPYLFLFFLLMGIIAGFRNAFYFIKKTDLWNDGKNKKT